MKTYGLRHTNDLVLSASSSGGAFTAFSDYILENNGVVIGAVYDCNNNTVKHIAGSDTEKRNLMRGSKYVQSNIGEIYRQVKELLDKGRTVLFTSTICQVSGLLSYLKSSKVNVSNLYTVDAICHGVGSPLIWKKFVESEMENYKIDKVDSVNFRDKSEGWNGSHVVLKSAGKDYSLQKFMHLYYGHTIMRPSCYKCAYTDLDRASDITIGDFWGVDESHPEFYSEKGNSFVMINSEKGKYLLDKTRVRKEIDIIECSVDDVNQPNFYQPSHKSVASRIFWSDYYRKGIHYIVDIYAGKSILAKMRVTCKKMIAYAKEKLKNGS